MAQFQFNGERKNAILAAYYNMARYNLFRTLYHIMNVSGVRVGNNFTEENIDKILVALYKSLANEEMNETERSTANSVGLNAVHHEKVRSMLFRHFPILAPTVDNLKAKDIKAHEEDAREHDVHLDEYSIMKGATLVDCLKILSNLATCITDIRNRYTHYNPFNTAEDLREQYKTQAIVARYLDVTIVASRRKVKERDNMDANKFDFLTGRTHFELVKENVYIQRLSQLPDYKREPWMEDKIENGEQKLRDKYDAYTKEFSDRQKKKEEKERKRGNQQRTNATPKEPLSYDRWMPSVPVELEDYYFNTKTWVEFGGNNGEVNHSKALSDFGLVYLCCLFLSKNYAKRLIEESDLMNNNSIRQNVVSFNGNMTLQRWNNLVDDVRNIIMPNVMIYYCIRTPKGRRLETDDTNIQLAMDMLNELRRCPKELYELLSQDDRDKFADKISAPTNQTDDQGRTIYEPTGERFVRLRHSDRFAELALRYIDQTQILPRIRFQVRLGKYRFKFYNKTTIDGQERLRILQKDINGYGCLNEIEKRRKEIWRDLIMHGEIRTVGENELEQLSEDTADSVPYVTDARATYNIAGNRIGLYWNIPGENVLTGSGTGWMYIPELRTDEHHKAIVNQPAPIVTLSTRELPALVFYEHLRNSVAFNTLSIEKRERFKRAEDIIKRQYENTVNLFQGIANGNITTMEQALACGVRLTDIPEKLREYLGNISRTKSNTYLYKNTIYENEPDDTVYEDGSLVVRYNKLVKRLDSFIANRKLVGTKDNKFAKKSHVDVRPGSLARYLGASIMDWLPSDSEGRKILTGLNYSVMVSMLASFGSTYNIYDLEALFSDSMIIGNATGNHPFLSSVLNRNPKNIEEFYEIYLRKEKDLLRSILDNASEDDNEIRGYLQEKAPFTHPNRKRWDDRNDDYYKDVAARYLSVDGRRATIQLPDSLFAQAIHDILHAMYPGNAAFANDVNNVSYLISSYLDLVMLDQSQDFYGMDGINYKRGYKFFTILRNEYEAANRRRVQYKSPLEILQELSRDSNQRDDEGHLIKAMSLSIRNRAAHLSEEEIANYRSKHRCENFHELMEKKLKRLMSECRKTERTLRRYRIQDVVVFLMAKKLLQGTLNLDAANTIFRLQNVTTNDFLNQTVTFRQPVDIDDSTRIYIVQENVSIKNYNMAFRYMKDERLASLLPQLIRIGAITDDGRGVYELPYSMLYNELGGYDNNRTRVFGLIHDIEKQALETVEGINDETFTLGDSEVPVRNNFNKMISRLDSIDDENKSIAVSIRNAFGHNHYPSRRTTAEETTETENRIRPKDMVDILGGQHVTLPQVAEAIEQKLESVRGNENISQS